MDGRDELVQRGRIAARPFGQELCDLLPGFSHPALLHRKNLALEDYDTPEACQSGVLRPSLETRKKDAPGDWIRPGFPPCLGEDGSHTMNALKVTFGGKCWKHFRNDDQIDIGECCARRAAMNAILILSCATALLAQSQTCTTTDPCSMSTNVPYDSAGTPDMRPGTWGNAASGSLSIPFLGVPAGYQVRITRVYGDVVAWPHGAIVPGAFSGILSGLTNTTPNQSAFVPSGLGNAGC